MSDMRAVDWVIDNYASVEFGYQLALKGKNFFE